MKTINYTPEEKIISEAIINARKIQDYIWADLNLINKNFNKETWVNVFSKRVIKIRDINEKSPNYKVELRKRVLQQAALSILALRILDSQHTYHTLTIGSQALR